MIQLVGSDFNAGIFLGGGEWFFTGIFEIFGVLVVVDLWSGCGGLDGEGGFQTDRFLRGMDFAFF
jgi:hypothetical protein